jgi:hypothetical protein
MLDEATRTTILKLHEQAHGTRAIARALGVARSSVRRVIESGRAEVPELTRAELAEDWREQILELYSRYQGHLGRVHEELTARGAALVLSGTHRVLPAPRHRHHAAAPGRSLRVRPRRRDAARHEPPSGEDRWCAHPSTERLIGAVLLAHDLLPVLPALHALRVQGVSFRRDRLLRRRGATCMIDNTHVVVAAGTGAHMIPAPEMAAFAERYGFVFKAHEKGDANRSARVEAPFWRIERGFLIGAEFSNWADLNQRARAACEAWNAKFSRKLHASRRELFASSSHT